METRNYETGYVNYVNNNSLSNSLTLSIDQQVPITGGKLSLQTYLYRLDQFTYDQITYNTQPIRLSYTQALRNYNALKWEQKIAPLEYEIAQRAYLTTMEHIAVIVTNLFFNALSAQSDYRQVLSVLNDREMLFAIAQKKLELGTITKSEVLQMELSLINSRMALSKQKIVLEDQLYRLYSYLRVTDYDNISLIASDSVPDIWLDAEIVLQKANENASYLLKQREELLQAERKLAQVKANKGIQLKLTGEIGLSQSGHSFLDAYSQLRDNEIVGLSLSLPIFDWGVEQGRVQVARAQLDVIRIRQEQDYQDYVHSIRKKVIEFNSQSALCHMAEKAFDISTERYELLLRRFETGTVSVLELNMAQQEKETARIQHLNQIRSFWMDYYALQEYSLYNWIEQRTIHLNQNQLYDLTME